MSWQFFISLTTTLELSTTDYLIQRNATYLIPGHSRGHFSCKTFSLAAGQDYGGIICRRRIKGCNSWKGSLPIQGFIHYGSKGPIAVYQSPCNQSTWGGSSRRLEGLRILKNRNGWAITITSTGSSVPFKYTSYPPQNPSRICSHITESDCEFYKPGGDWSEKCWYTGGNVRLKMKFPGGVLSILETYWDLRVPQRRERRRSRWKTSPVNY